MDISKSLRDLRTLADFLVMNNGTEQQWDALATRITEELAIEEQKGLMAYVVLPDSIYTDLSMRHGEMGA